MDVCLHVCLGKVYPSGFIRLVYNNLSHVEHVPLKTTYMQFTRSQRGNVPLTPPTSGVFGCELSQDLGIPQCLLGPSRGDEGEELELVELELQAGAMLQELAAMHHRPPEGGERDVPNTQFH